jgi:hypothetical protein
VKNEQIEADIGVEDDALGYSRYHGGIPLLKCVEFYADRAFARQESRS